MFFYLRINVFNICDLFIHSFIYQFIPQSVEQSVNTD